MERTGEGREVRESMKSRIINTSNFWSDKSHPEKWEGGAVRINNWRWGSP